MARFSQGVSLNSLTAPVNVNVNVPVLEKSKKGLSMAAEVCSMGRPAWLDGSWTSGSGRRFERCSALGAERGALGKTTEISSKRCCGGVGPGFLGGIYL
jgi:hypothetical protein